MKKKYLSLLALTVSLGLIVAGVINNQPHEVFTKAIRICLECVGIG